MKTKNGDADDKKTGEEQERRRKKKRKKRKNENDERDNVKGCGVKRSGEQGVNRYKKIIKQAYTQ
jgi:hypothetical protein